MLLESLTKKYGRSAIIDSIKESDADDIVFVDIIDYDYINGKRL